MGWKMCNESVIPFIIGDGVCIKWIIIQIRNYGIVCAA